MPVDPWALDTLSISGLEVRNVDAMLVMSNGSALGSTSGVRPGDPGLTVTLAGSTINCSAGVAAVAYTGQGVYRAAFPSSVSPGTLTAAHATLDRIDLVYVRVWDNAVDASGLAKGDIVYLAGTPSSTPVAPTPAGTQIYMPLATISVPHTGAGSPSVSTSVRPVTVAPGGILPSSTAPSAPYVGQYWDDGTGLKRWNGSAWSYVQNLGIGKILFARRTSDLNRSTATLTDDPQLSLTVEANAVYTVEGMLHWYTSDETNADLNIDFTTPAGATGTYLSFAQPTSGITTQGEIRTMSTAIDAARTFGADADTANPSGMIFRSLLITSGSAGTYALQWARTGASGTLTMLQNTYLALTRVA